MVYKFKSSSSCTCSKMFQFKCTENAPMIGCEDLESWYFFDANQPEMIRFDVLLGCGSEIDPVKPAPRFELGCNGLVVVAQRVPGVPYLLALPPCNPQVLCVVGESANLGNFFVSQVQVTSENHSAVWIGLFHHFECFL